MGKKVYVPDGGAIGQFRTIAGILHGGKITEILTVSGRGTVAEVVYADMMKAAAMVGGLTDPSMATMPYPTNVFYAPIQVTVEWRVGQYPFPVVAFCDDHESEPCACPVTEEIQ